VTQSTDSHPLTRLSISEDGVATGRRWARASSPCETPTRSRLPCPCPRTWHFHGHKPGVYAINNLFAIGWAVGFARSGSISAPSDDPALFRAATRDRPIAWLTRRARSSFRSRVSSRSGNASIRTGVIEYRFDQ